MSAPQLMLLTGLLGYAVLASPAHADSQLAVATFDNERPEWPGTTVTRWLRISNLGNEDMHVGIFVRGVNLLDDGQARVGDGQDALWADRISVPTPELDLVARSSRDVEISVAIPPDMPPDEYILGVAVSPVPNGGGSHVINEIGALIPLSVQGDRLRSLELADHQLPAFVIGDSVTGTVRVKNTGTTLANAWLEAAVDDAILGDHRAEIQNRNRTRVAPGTMRDLSYTWEAGITAGKFRVPVRVSYNRENAMIVDLTVDEEVWLIHHYFVAAAAGLLGLLLLWVLRLRVAATRHRPRLVPVSAATSA